MTEDSQNESTSDDTEMGECGACRALIPVTSTSCPECKVSFEGVEDADLGECGACQALIPIDSTSCSECGVQFVLDDLKVALSDWMKDEGLTITGLFNAVDENMDGTISTDEIRTALAEQKIAFLAGPEMDRLMVQIDLNRDGELSFGELAAALAMPFDAPEKEEEVDVEEEMAASVDLEEVADDVGVEVPEEEESVEESEEESEEESWESEEVEVDLEDHPEEDEDEDSEDEDDSVEDDEEDDSSDDSEEESEEESDEEDEDAEDDAEEEEESDDDSEEEEESEEPAEEKPAKEGPEPWQVFLMRNYENVFPILYVCVALVMGVFIANGLGMFVDGTGGNIAYDGADAHITWVNENGALRAQTIQPGDIYPCDPEVQDSGCRNSIVLFGAEGDQAFPASMPAGFHTDGVLMLVLCVAALGGIYYLSMQTKEWRQLYRKKKTSDDAEEEEESPSADDAEEEESSEEEAEDESEEVESTEEASDEDESEEEESDDEEESEESDEEEEEGELQIGSRVEVEDEDGNWTGEVTEFDDDNDVVIVKRDDDGDEYEVDWDVLFMIDE